MNKKWIYSIFLFLILVGAIFPNVTGDDYNHAIKESEKSYHILIKDSDVNLVSSILKNQGMDVLNQNIEEKSIELIVNSFELESLKNNNYEITIIAESRPYKEIQNELIEMGLLVPPGYPELDDGLLRNAIGAQIDDIICGLSP